MEATFHSDIGQFCDLCFPFLIQKEAENNLLFGILNNLKTNLQTYSEKHQPVLISITENGVLKLISLQTPPYNQVISYTEDLTTIPFLVEELSHTTPDIPGILGFKEGAQKFGQLWTKKHHKTLQLDMHERVYQLEEVNPETLGTHEFQLATIADKQLIHEWTKAFTLEATPSGPLQEEVTRQKHIDRAINHQRIYVLKDNDTLVTMAQKAGHTPHGQTINAVYTPPKERRKGYETEVVAKLSQNILNDGKKYCFLFTDLANPTSNKIYQNIGYQPIIDIDVYLFSTR